MKRKYSKASGTNTGNNIAVLVKDPSECHCEKRSDVAILVFRRGLKF
jgi:hypothetical protein